MALRHIVDDTGSFISLFCAETGFYCRSNLRDESGRFSEDEAFMASFPHLVDVGIMGHCMHGQSGLCLEAGIGCYQRGAEASEPNMPLADFLDIAEQCRGSVFQFALGGRGDPDQHEQFPDILEACAANDIVPNFTTSGFGLSDEDAQLCRQFCGAVAVSWYRSDYTLAAIDRLTGAGVTTNIHFVLTHDTITEAAALVSGEGLPAGVNAIVFLLHKPVGLGRWEDVLQPDHPELARFFEAAVSGQTKVRIGFDSCCVPGLINYAPDLDWRFVETCEGARFSCYITPDLKMLPCSFDQSYRWAVDLRTTTMAAAWTSPRFAEFRSILQTACPDCPSRLICLGGCPVEPKIVLCRLSDRVVGQPAGEVLDSPRGKAVVTT